jgi:hypothetical protein
MKNKNLVYLIALLFVASALPNLIGYFSTNPKQVYSGVVFNPIDGYTYLAKMQIGKSGDWLFTLPFTALAGDGRFLYPFYIAAGQLFSQIRIPLSVGFNVLRLLGYAFLVLFLARLAEKVYQDNIKARSTAVLLIAAGGGLGWILLPFGKFGADFWVAEAFPFLSGLANPHFPLALGLMVAVLLITPSVTRNSLIGLILIGLFLSILSPFGFIVAAGVLLLNWFWEKQEGQATSIVPVVIFILSGLPYSAYQYWAVNSSPQFAAWTAQNQTPSPQLWDILLTFSPWILLLAFSWRDLLKQRKNPVVRKLIVWMAVGLVLSIIPFSLQRRFMFGLSIPTTCLGLLVLPYVAEKLRFSARKMTSICMTITLLTPVLILSMTCSAIAMHTPLYYYHSDELSAINWLSSQQGGRQIVLAGDQTGTMIPAVSRLRVIYGHPFETISADEEKQAVSDFFSGKYDSNQANNFLKTNQVDWILYGPREQEIGSPEYLKKIDPIKKFGEVSLYKVEEILPLD